MASYYYEDFKIGDEWTYDAWVIEEAPLVEFATRYDPQPMHTDAAAAAEGPYGGLIASGWQTALNCVSPFLNDVMKNTAGLASPGFEVFQWLKPVHADAPVVPRTKVLDKRLSNSKPDLGLVKFRFTGTDAEGDVVWKAEGTFFITARGEADG